MDMVRLMAVVPMGIISLRGVLVRAQCMAEASSTVIRTRWLLTWEHTLPMAKWCLLVVPMVIPPAPTVLPATVGKEEACTI